ncbi:hypothetical protein CONCODRAFT_12674 [Conidiobolus coronatus NRRL 28638]|uniref:Uncharacterized protein n=1 Tax=Conidiobolus coronatus (strain ATCC 28846 / CBS 209.66 / NRRL 28638) TaxID=796925 RepID=A0A137NSH9_CONC2|nr:hypothetical protein CONCODRAFT_12674 [Conidiobolus coronatus NRRL 28638]|eukprot:KXN65671.1 hypothetical protein CONCODRAFT_12674 [Conidiobolus coronatus NRRL 28638]
MFIKLALVLIPLTQLVSADYCNRYGQKKELYAKYEPAYGGYRSYVSCKNTDDNGCFLNVKDPYEGIVGQQCHTQEVKPGDSTTNYTCENGDAINDFYDRAQKSGWKCVRIAE